jgi:NTE family protein
MSVDVAEGAAVAFDSYETEDGFRKSEYGKYITQDGKEVGHQHIIWYNDGITSEHVIASASVPINYGYTPLEVESYNNNKANSANILAHLSMTHLLSNHLTLLLRVQPMSLNLPNN